MLRKQPLSLWVEGPHVPPVCPSKLASANTCYGFPRWCLSHEPLLRLPRSNEQASTGDKCSSCLELATSKPPRCQSLTTGATGRRGQGRELQADKGGREVAALGLTWPWPILVPVLQSPLSKTERGFYRCSSSACYSPEQASHHSEVLSQRERSGKTGKPRAGAPCIHWP